MKLIDEDGSVSQEMLSIIENTNDLIFIKDRNFVYIAASKNYAVNCVHCNGVEDVIGKTDFELFEDKSIAARYRSDDEILFATGKNKIDFQEEYPGQDGEKHYCLSSKYLLHDKDGNPSAIFGQYHNMGELIAEECAHQRNIEKKITDTLAHSFFTINYVDLKEDKFQIIRSTDYGRKMLENAENLEQAFDAFIRTLVKPEYYDRMYEFCDMNTITERIKGERQISCEYFSTVVNGWCRTSFYPVEWDEKGNVTQLLFMISSVDALKAKEIEDGIKSQRNLDQIFQERLRGFEKSTEDAMCMCDVNLTQNQFFNLQTDAMAIIKQCGEKAKTLDEFMQLASNAVFDPDEQKEYRALFQRDTLLERFKQGESHIKFEHFYRIDTTNTAIVETVFDLIQDPMSGDVVGICYTKNRNSFVLSDFLLKTSLDRDYMRVALVYADTKEYYLYEFEKKEYCTHKQGYWGGVYERLVNYVDEQTMEGVRSNLNGEKVENELEYHDEYLYAFYAVYRGKRSRLEAKYCYVDKKHHLLLASLRNITDEDLYEQYKYESEHDELTGLYNRKTVFTKCRELLNDYPEETFVMAHIDMKHFRLFNSFFGDEAGDQLLCDIAEMFRSLTGEYDHWVYGRIEADVFCAFFPYEPEKYQKHLTAILQYLKGYRADFLIEPKVGIYLVTDSEMTVEAMFTRATLASKEVRPGTVNATVFYDEKLEKELSGEQQVINDMQTAIEQEQFEVYLQPKYSLQSEELTGAEALVRWKHPERGMISPGVFIPVFEKNGFITELDKYMWEHVCQILRKWKDEGKTMYPISVNISRVSMYIQTTVPFLKSLIEKYQFDPKYLELELTESAYMDDPEDLKRMLRELQEYGFKILMDDFGSGYSSLNTLRDLPVDVLKLDMKFLSETVSDTRGQAVLSSVVRMSKLLNLPTIAEGVEKKEQVDYLRSIGCEYVQGFLYAKPMPAIDYEKLLKL